jgi:hypothetical protein
MVASGYVMLITFIAQVLIGSHASHAYVLVEHFFYPGDCDSAAQINSQFVLACKAGIWLGPPENLHLALSCAASDDQPNRVRVFDENSVVAATSCGLYRIYQSGDSERIPTSFESPGAFDADGKGRMVVAADGWLWSWSLRHQDWRRLVPEAQEKPQRIELADGYVLRAGQSTEVIGFADGQQERMLEDASWHTLLVGRRLLSVDEGGIARLSAIANQEGKSRYLDLAPHERIQTALGWGMQALVHTTARMLLVGDKTLIWAHLPSAGSEWIPVRAGGGLPWLIGPGGLYRPLPNAPRKWSAARAARIDMANLHRTRFSYRPPASNWSLFLPHIELRASGEHRYAYLNRSDNGRVDSKGDALIGGWLMLVWDLPSSRYQAYLSDHESLRRELRQAESERIAQVATLITNWLEPSEPDEFGGLIQEEFEAQLEMLSKIQ